MSRLLRRSRKPWGPDAKLTSALFRRLERCQALLGIAGFERLLVEQQHFNSNTMVSFSQVDFSRNAV